MPSKRSQLHLSGARFENRIELGARLDDLPGSFEAGGHDERVADAKLPARSRWILERYLPRGEAAEFGFGVTDAPLAGRARPAPGEELLGRVAEMIRDRLARRPRDAPVGGGFRRFARDRLPEIDDVVAHACPRNESAQYCTRRCGPAPAPPATVTSFGSVVRERRPR